LLLGFSSFAQLRDGGIDPKNLGKGDWIYILSSAVNQMGGNVPGVTNLASLMAYQKNQGMQYLIIKAADGHTHFPSEANPQFSAAVVDAGHAAGLKIFGYNRSFGTNIPGELAIVDEVFNLGADGFVIDAESEWKTVNLPNNTIIATNFLSALRTNWPNKFIAHSPFAFISSHSTFPYKEFGYYCDAAIPQIYFIEFGMSASAAVAQTSLEWRNWQNGLTGKWTNSIKPLAPAGQGWSGSGPCTAADITEFVNALKNDPNPATAGGYKGVNYWRADLHPPDVLAAIRTNNIGTVPTNPPVVTNLTSTVSDTSATIIWTTDQSSSSVVEYGLTTSYGTAVTNATMLYYHTMIVGGLSPNTTYHYRVSSRNGSDQTGFSADSVFTTLAAAVTDVIVESRKTDGTLTANPPYTDTSFSDSTLKSSAGGLVGTGSRYGFSGTPNYTIRPTLAVAGGSYDVYLTHGSAGSISDDITVSITQTGCTGLPATTTLFREANGNSWEYLGRLTCNANTNVPSVKFSYASGTLNSTNGRMYSDAIKFVYVPPPPTGPSIANQPQNQVVNQGNTAVFNVTASGTAPLIYQWRRSGTNLPGATLSSYTINNAQPADAGTYSVLITNSVNSLLSSNATLTVNVPPSISQQPQSVTTNAGVDVLFSVAASGTPPLYYQWRFNDAPVDGATGTAYTRTNVQNGDVGNYSVVVSNLAGSVTSDPASLSLLTTQALPPHIDSITLLSDAVQLQFSGGPGMFALEVSPTLTNFTQLTTLNATGSVFQFTDPETNHPSRFYRLRVTP
jgi:hypothetical protein